MLQRSQQTSALSNFSLLAFAPSIRRRAALMAQILKAFVACFVSAASL
jgi:hypothetical protein